MDLSSDHTSRDTTAALIGVAAAWNVLQNRVLPRWTYVAANVAGTAAALAVARRLGLSAAEIGVARENMGRGVRAGAALGSSLVVAVAAGVRSNRTRRLFADERAAGLTLQALAHETMVRIPLGTALFEETLFRGLLLAWLRRRTSPARALAQSSGLFGAWHVLPTWTAMTGYAGGALRSRSTATTIAGITAAVVTTGAAGAGLGWLRLRTGSLAAPTIVHAAVNAAGFVGAWTVMRQSA
jgi:membrane protease YdiL (CAAX protease family)